jgi:hypothetical protein
MKDFKTIPDDITDLLDSGEITIKDWMVAHWVYTHYNSRNGYCVTGFNEITTVFKGIISYDLARKIFGKLRHLKVIAYRSHRGAGGKFRVWPSKIKRSKDVIQMIDEHGVVQNVTDNNQPSISNKSPIPEPSVITDESQLSSQNHNQDSQNTPGTLTDNDSENSAVHNHLDEDENEDENEDEDEKNNTNDSFFLPKGKKGEELVIKEISELASELGDSSINALLKLESECGLAVMRRARVRFRRYSKGREGVIVNPAAYFTSIVRTMYEEDQPSVSSLSLSDTEEDDIPF